MNSMRAINKKARKVEESVIAVTGDVQALQARGARPVRLLSRMWVASPGAGPFEQRARLDRQVRIGCKRLAQSRYRFPVSGEKSMRSLVRSAQAAERGATQTRNSTPAAARSE